MPIAWATPDRAVRARQGQAADYQPDQGADCLPVLGEGYPQAPVVGFLPGLEEDYPQAQVVDFLQGQEAAYLLALVAGSLLGLEAECLQVLAAANQQGRATTGGEFRRDSLVARERVRVLRERLLLVVTVAQRI